MKEEKENMYMLMFNSDDGVEYISSSVIACRNIEVLTEYKEKLEKKSAIIRKKIAVIKEKKDKLIQPLWEENHRLLQCLIMLGKTEVKKEERMELRTKQKKIHDKISSINHDFYNDKDTIFNDLDMEIHDCFIDDEDTGNFSIEVFEVLKG
jgi:hypothetical protein